MKKFLTVLLVIAVMFTFSFGSAFAAPVANYNKSLATANFDIAMDAVKEAGEIELDADGTISPDVEGYTVDYATFNSFRAEILALALYEAEKGSLDDYVASLADLQALLAAAGDGMDLATEIVAAQYTADKDGYLAVLNGLDLSAYSTANMSEEDADGCKTYRDHVQYLIDEAKDAIKDAGAALDADSYISDYVTAAEAFTEPTGSFTTGIFDLYDGNDDNNTKLVAEKGYSSSGTPVGLGIYEVNADYIVDDTPDPDITLANYKTTYVEGQDAADAAGIASVKAAIAQEYAKYIQANTTSAAKAYAANVKKVLDFLADEQVDLTESTTRTIAYYFNTGNVAAATVEAAIAAVETFEVEAAQLAAQTDANGVLVRDAEDVADLVTEGTILAYTTAVGVTYTSADYANMAECKTAITNLYVGLGDAELEFMKAVRADFVASLLADFEENETYYPAELEKVKALTEEYLAKVNAVTDIDDVDNYDSAYFDDITTDPYVVGGKLDDIDDASDVAALATDLQDAAQQYTLLMNNQISKNANKYYMGLDKAGITVYTDGTFDKLNELVEDLVGNSGARLSKDVAALSDQAMALYKQLPTYAEVEAALEAADDAVDALPTTAKIADKALVDAAIAAIDAYETMTAETYATYNGTGAAAVVTATTQYAYAYNNEFTDKVDAVVTTDKAAVEALIDEVDAFVEKYDSVVDADDLYDIFGATTGNYADLEGYLADIQAAAAKKVTEAIAAIPVTSNITEAARSAVDAARAAYDAYVAEYTDTTDYSYTAHTGDLPDTVTTDGFVANDFAANTLFSAEAALGLETGVNTFDDVDAKAYLQDLALKARSVKTAKGNVKVTVVADVDTLIENGYTVEYKFYRSTKSNKGFGKAKKVSEEATYTNTSGVKGTKYYYKAVVVAKDAEGNVVAKTPLKHCLYATRTWSK